MLATSFFVCEIHNTPNGPVAHSPRPGQREQGTTCCFPRAAAVGVLRIGPLRRQLLRATNRAVAASIAYGSG